MHVFEHGGAPSGAQRPQLAPPQSESVTKHQLPPG